MTKPCGTAWAIHSTSGTSRQAVQDKCCLPWLAKRCHPKETLPPFVSGPNPLGDIDQHHTIEVNSTDSSWLNWLQSTQSMNQMLSRWYTVFDSSKQSLCPETRRSLLGSKQTRQNRFHFWPRIYHFTLKRFFGGWRQQHYFHQLLVLKTESTYGCVYLCWFFFFSFSSCLY